MIFGFRLDSSGMGSDEALLVKSVNSLEGDETINFRNSGCDVTSKLYQESLIKGQYYYQIPKEKDRFGKYQISNVAISTVAEQAFKTNTYKDRRYSFAWLNDDSFVIIAANGFCQ